MVNDPIIYMGFIVEVGSLSHYLHGFFVSFIHLMSIAGFLNQQQYLLAKICVLSIFSTCLIYIISKGEKKIPGLWHHYSFAIGPTLYFEEVRRVSARARAHGSSRITIAPASPWHLVCLTSNPK